MRLTREGKALSILVRHFSGRFTRAMRKRGYIRHTSLRREYEERFYDLIDGEDYGEHDYKLNSLINIFLGIACYQVAREHGCEDAETVAVYDDTCHTMRALARWLYQRVERLPHGFNLVKRSITADLLGPSALCWTTEVVQNDSHALEYKITRCLYLTMCERYKCRFFCQVFCNHDNWAYGAMNRKVRFVRYSTLVDGPCCHDVFLNTTGEKQG